ncbi:MAG: restriction endonuclease [Planctomycetes bacterium]|nr:restriction endonuclease [Planctomycetota bacterium]
MHADSQHDTQSDGATSHCTDDEVEDPQDFEQDDTQEDIQSDTPTEETPDPLTSVDPAHMTEWSQSEFRLWCGRLFKRFAYEVALDDQDCDLRLERGDGIAVVDCVAEPGDTEVTRAHCQRLVGAMVGSRVLRGIVVTTGTFSDDCRNYASGLDGVTLDLIDGIELAKTIEAMRSGPLLKWLVT